MLTDDNTVVTEKKQTRTSDESFITAWQAGKTAELVAEALGLERGSAMQRAAKLRKEGIILKQFKSLSFGRVVRDAAYIERMNALAAAHYVGGDDVKSDDGSSSEDN
jgi:hypothetical protein